MKETIKFIEMTWFWNLPIENQANEDDYIEMFHSNPVLIDDDQLHVIDFQQIQPNFQMYISIDQEKSYVYPKIHPV